MLDPRMNIPQIDTSQAPPTEKDDLRLLNQALKDIDRYICQFKDAVHLFDYCLIQKSVMPGATSEAFINWQFVAARDAIMSIWHFRNEIAAANTMANRSPYVSPQLNRHYLRDAHSLFDKDFPYFGALRHGVAHEGEVGKSKASYDEHAFDGTYQNLGISITNSTGIMVQNSLNNRTYMTTWAKKIVHCDISGETLMKLQEIARLFFSGFKSVDPAPAAQTQSDQSDHR